MPKMAADTRSNQPTLLAGTRMARMAPTVAIATTASVRSRVSGASKWSRETTTALVIDATTAVAASATATTVRAFTPPPPFGDSCSKVEGIDVDLGEHGEPVDDVIGA